MMLSGSDSPKFENGKVSLDKAPWDMHEFFAGSGLVAYGLKGLFRPVWSNDIDEQKASVYSSNFDSKHFVLDDIKNIKGDKLPPAHLSWASFPCQDLSLAGSIGGINAARSGLVWEWLRVLDELKIKPKILVIENVYGLVSSHNGDNYRQLHAALYNRGYISGAMIVDAVHFLPQSRPRVFVIAVQKDISIPKELTSTKGSWLHNKQIMKLGSELPGWIWWNASKPKDRKTTISDVLEDGLEFDKNDVLRLIPDNHKANLDTYSSIIATGYRRTRKGKQQLELRFDGVAGCLRTPGGGSSKQFLVVKFDNEIKARLLSTREAARLMGAPDSFILPKSQNDSYKAMGDAVAMPVARFIGENFLDKLAEVAYHG